jgi:hypothetical protein
MECALTLDTLGNLDDGRARGIINAAILAAVADFDDRGDDEKPRTVEVKLTLQKVRGMLGVEVTAKTSLPTYRTERTACRILQQTGKRGTQPAMFFQDMAPDNPEQETIDKHLPGDHHS